MTTKHTPTPWAVDFRTDRDIVQLPRGGDPENANDLNNDSLAIAHTDADAAFIVRAVNAHDALVAALRALVDARDRPHGFADLPWYEPAFAQARAALAGVQS